MASVLREKASHFVEVQ